MVLPTRAIYGRLGVSAGNRVAISAVSRQWNIGNGPYSDAKGPVGAAGRTSRRRTSACAANSGSAAELITTGAAYARQPGPTAHPLSGRALREPDQPFLRGEPLSANSMGTRRTTSAGQLMPAHPRYGGGLGRRHRLGDV